MTFTEHNICKGFFKNKKEMSESEFYAQFLINIS
jgi:hypothetical protein